MASRSMADLDRLKADILEHFSKSGLPLFPSLGHPNEEGYTYWDTKQYPDWRQFLEVALQSGARLLTFSTHTFLETELDQVHELCDDLEIPPPERKAGVKVMDAAADHLGETAWVRLTWHLDGRRFAYQRIAPWYENLLDMMDDFTDFLPDLDDADGYLEDDEDEDDEPAGRGGFYSPN